MIISISHAKKVITKDLAGNENGHLIELFKDGRRTSCYLTTVKPGCFKGFHKHLVRESNYVCIKGRVEIILCTLSRKEKYILDADLPQRLHVPINIPIGIKNDFEEEAWLINYPVPAYDPLLKDEQIDFTEEQIDAGEHKIF